MICPHCEKSLLAKERTGNVCGSCRRAYALDPRTNPLRLHDLRVRRIADRITRDGELTCTPGQLWYALSRRSLREPRVDMGCAGVLAAAGLVLGFTALVTWSAGYAVPAGLLLTGALGFLIARLAGMGRGRPRVTREAFRTGPLQEWKRVYGTLPPGLTDDDRWPPARRPPPDGPVLLCPDRSIAVFLDAAGLTTRYGVRLAAGPDTLPATTAPVLVLHDADAHGLTLADRVRQASPARRVVDIGLPLDAVHGHPRAVPVRGAPPGPEVMEPLRRGGRFGAGQLKWLGAGWGFPLVGVEPARLLAAVCRAVERAGAAADPASRRAAALGFLTWPEGGTG